MWEAFAGVGALLAGLGALSWAFAHAWKLITGERSANLAGAYAAAAKVLVDELQEEVVSARAEAKVSRNETARARLATAAATEEVEILRRNINTLRTLTDREIARLRNEITALRAQIPPALS